MEARTETLRDHEAFAHSKKLSSFELVRAALRVAEIMELAADPTADTATVERLDEECLALLEALGDGVPDKLESLRAVCLRLEAETGMLKEEEARLYRRRKASERGCVRVRDMGAAILQALRETGQEPKVKTATHSFSLRRSVSLVGPEFISAWEEMGWTASEVKVRPDKKRATAAIKESGIAPDGFALVERESIAWK